MSPLLGTLLVSVAAIVLGALLVAIGRALVDMSRNVRDSTTAVRALVGDVGELQRDNASNRERLAALEAAAWPHEYTYPTRQRWAQR